MVTIRDPGHKNTVKVDDCGVLMVGLDGFTIKDLADHYQGFELMVGLHVKDGDNWVPIKLEDLQFKDK